MDNDVLPRRTVAAYAAGSVGTGGFGVLPGLVLSYVDGGAGVQDVRPLPRPGAQGFTN